MRIRRTVQREQHAVRITQIGATEKRLPNETLRNGVGNAANREEAKSQILNLGVHVVAMAQHRKGNALFKERIG